jgi:hypothetical protein
MTGFAVGDIQKVTKLLDVRICSAVPPCMEAGAVHSSLLEVYSTSKYSPGIQSNLSRAALASDQLGPSLQHPALYKLNRSGARPGS